MDYDLQYLFWYGMDRRINQPASPPPGQRINLGVGHKQMPHGVKSIGLPEWNADTMRLPYATGTVAEVWALHFLEHVQRPIAVLAEVQRVLMPGGVCNIVVPYGTCHMAVQDLSHTHFFNESSWDHAFQNPYYDDHDVAQGWHLRQHINLIMGVKGENLALVTQLVRTT